MAVALALAGAYRLYEPAIPALRPAQLPPRTFGVFVGLERSAAQRLPTFPYDIHGCIGYWDPDYKPIGAALASQKIREVAYSANWTDGRSRSHRRPFAQDANGLVKVYFMQLPLQEIDFATGTFRKNGKGGVRVFDNAVQGLIVDTGKGQRATYLPEVFPGLPWADIRDSLLDKAGLPKHTTVTAATAARFYAYVCVIEKASLLDILRTEFAPRIVADYVRFMNRAFTDRVPYSVNKEDVIDYRVEPVRNAATLADLSALHAHLSVRTQTALKREIARYLGLWEADPVGMRQAGAFLVGLAPHPLRDSMCAELTEAALGGSLEPVFELSEVLIGLKGNCSQNRRLDALVRKTLRDARDRTNLFEVAWHAKLWRVYGSPPTEQTPLLRRTLLAFGIKDYRQPIGFEGRESNEVAVFFEATAALGMVDEATAALLVLMSRFHDGLVAFRDGVSRIDITGHTLTGLALLHEGKGKEGKEGKTK